MTSDARFEQAREKLTGLPERSVWEVAGVEISYVFYGLDQDPSTIPAEELRESAIPAVDWPQYLPFGERIFDGGAAPYFCVHSTTGCIFLVDLESDDPVTLLNHSAEQFVKSFGVASSALSGAVDLHLAASALREIDVKAFDQPNDWRELVEQLIREAGDA
jgi:hypothetical protein